MAYIQTLAASLFGQRILTMKRLIYSLTLMTLLSNCSSGQQSKPTETKTMDDFELSPDKAHPNAKKLLTEDFYWSPIDETGPFGSDDASDCFYSFVEWRIDNKSGSPVTYLKELIDEWGYPTFDLNITDPQRIKELLDSMDSRMLIGQDNAIVAIGFGQFVLEGKIDNDIRDLTRKAIKRELTTELVNQFREDYRETRKGQLEKMLSVVDKM
jgi:uncharacterized protein YfeS